MDEKQLRMDETKKVLRSILVSSPMTVNVTRLNIDHKEVTGFDIPYTEYGYRNLLDFLNAIPDVLRVNGNSLRSEVTLIVSEKTAHVNDMVLKQKIKKGGGVGGFHATSRKRGGLKFGPPPRTNPKLFFTTKSSRFEYSNEPQQSETKNNTKNCSRPLGSSSYRESNNAPPPNRNIYSWSKGNKNDSVENENPKIIQRPYEDIKLKGFDRVGWSPDFNEPKKETNLPLSRLNYKENNLNDESPHTFALSKIDSVKKNFNNNENNGTKNTDKHLLRRLNYKEHHLSDSTSRISSLFDREVDVKNLSFDKDDFLKKDTGDFMRELLLRKDSLKGSSERNSLHVNKGPEKIFIDEKNSVAEPKREEKYIYHSRIPRHIQDNLRILIADFPEGIWCSQLPNEYRKRFKRELHFDDLGFMCLINMCMELEDIFHCSKESTCDFKLYDARKPMPRIEILEDNHVYISKYSGTTPAFLEDEASPPLDWATYEHLLPEAAVGRGVEIPRTFVSPSEIKKGTFLVVAAEIYDPSKFWLYRDDGELDALMDQMQPFYLENKERYRIPEQLLEPELYCIVVTLNEFHRCVIVKIQPDATFVHVFFIDYGTLGTAPKDEVWFLTDDFARLPAQAIRARLGNIYPPVENTTWSLEATSRFRKLASMKHLKARITKVLTDKKVIEVFLENPILAPGIYINTILVDEGHALNTNKERRMNIEDPNCIPRVKFVHLFPDFEEIEYWLAPSINEMAWFSNTDLTTDFFFPQYFTRTIDRYLHDKIESKAKKLIRKKVKPVKYIKPKHLKTMQNMGEILKVSYGDLYGQYEERLNEAAQRCDEYLNFIESDEQPNEENNWKLIDMDCGDYQNFLNKLRSKRFDSKDVRYKTGEPLTWKLPKTQNFFLAANEEKYNNQVGRDDSHGRYEKTGIPTTSGRIDTSGVEKYLSQLDLTELEKYLSEEEPSTLSPNNTKLIDAEVFESHYQGKSSPNHVPSVLSRNESVSGSTRRRRRTRVSLLSGSSTSDEEKPGPRLARCHSFGKRSNSVCSDLIQFDVVLDSPILMPEILGTSIPTSKTAVSCNSVENVSDDADDEDDSDIRLKPDPESRSTYNAVRVNESTVTGNACCSNDPNASDMSIENQNSSGRSPLGLDALHSAVPSSSNDTCVNDMSNVHPSSSVGTSLGSNALRCEVSSSSNVPNVGNFWSNIVPVVRPPPGFAPLPRYNTHPPPGYTVYQPWSTGVGDDVPMNFHSAQNRMAKPINGMSYTPQQFVAQVSSMYRFPPIVVFNYNALPPMPSNAHIERSSQQNMNIQFSDNYNNMNRFPN